MKFFVFNLVVIASLGYIFYERGDLDGTKVAALVTNAQTAVSTRLDPEPSTIGKPKVVVQIPENVEQPPANEEPQSEPAADIFTPPPASPPALQPLEEIEVAPVILNKSVSPAVEKRRAVVLGTETETDDLQFHIETSADRKEKLRILAEEMEFLSVDLIYH